MQKHQKMAAVSSTFSLRRAWSAHLASGWLDRRRDRVVAVSASRFVLHSCLQSASAWLGLLALWNQASEARCSHGFAKHVSPEDGALLAAGADDEEAP